AAATTYSPSIARAIEYCPPVQPLSMPISYHRGCRSGGTAVPPEMARILVRYCYVTEPNYFRDGPVGGCRGGCAATTRDGHAHACLFAALWCIARPARRHRHGPALGH